MSVRGAMGAIENLVTSVFGRVGDILAQAGDYIAGQITRTPTADISADDVDEALQEIVNERMAIQLNGAGGGEQKFLNFVENGNITIATANVGANSRINVSFSAGGGAGAGDGYNIIAAGSQTAGTTGTVVFSNSNNVSFGMTNSSIVTATATFAQSLQTQSRFNLTLAGNSTSAGAGYIQISSGVMTLAGGNNVTLSQDGNAVTVSAVNTVAQSVQTQNFVAVVGAGANGTATFSSGSVTLAAGDNMTLSTGANVISFHAPAGGGGATLSFWNNANFDTGAAIGTTNLTASSRSLFVFPLNPSNEVFPGAMTASTARMLMSISASTASVTNSHSFGISLGIYKISASNAQSTLSLINSVGSSFAKPSTATVNAQNSYSGIRWFEFASSQWSAAPVFDAGVRYYGALLYSWSSISFNTLAFYGGSVMSTFNASGTFNALSATNTSRGFHASAGIYTATTNAFPASIHISQLNKQTGNANWVPYLEFDALNSVH